METANYVVDTALLGPRGQEGLEGGAASRVGILVRGNVKTLVARLVQEGQGLPHFSVVCPPHGLVMGDLHG